MSDAGLDPGGAVAVNRFPFGGAIQALLQLRKVLGRFVFFPGLDQGHHLLLGVTGGLQQGPIEFAAAKRGASLFGGGSGVSHKRKSCRREAVYVNP